MVVIKAKAAILNPLTPATAQTRSRPLMADMAVVEAGMALTAGRTESVKWT